MCINRFLVIFTLLCVVLNVNAQRFHEFAHKNIIHYSSEETKGFAQSWAVTQGFNGLMYFGNGAGILEYDGSTWRTIALGNAIRTFYKSGNGVIYAGGDNLIGYLKPDDNGKMDYYSLLDSIPEDLRDFVAVLSVYRKDGLIYFIAFKGIYIFSDNKFIKTIRPETDFRFAFQIRHKLFVRESGFGLMEIKNESVIPVPGGSFFAEKPVYMMAELNNSQVIIGTSKRGLFTTPLSLLLEEKNTRIEAKEFVSEANSFLIKNILSNGIVLDNGNIALATSLGGIIIIDKAGEIVNIFNKHTGLKIVNSTLLHQDSYGNLWAALQNGIAKIELNDAIGFFPEETEIPGLINTIYIHNKILYIGTMEGLFTIEKNPDYIKDEKLYKTTKINSDFNSVMQLNYVKKEILASARFNFFSIHDKIIHKISSEEFGFVAYQYKKNPNLLFSSNANGLIVYEYENGAWKLLGQVDGITYEIRSISETRDGDIWLNSFQGKLPRLHFNDNNYLSPIIKWYDKENGLPEIIKFNVEPEFDSLTVMADAEFYSYNGKTDFFEPAEVFPRIIDGDTINYNNYCLFNRNLAYCYTNKGFIKFNFTKNSCSGSEIIYPRGITSQSFFIRADTINNCLWFSTDKGLFVLNLNKINPEQSRFQTVIRQIWAGKDSLVFNGVCGDSLSYIIEIPFSKNSLTILFSSLYFEKQELNEYSYMLAGLDTAWLAWTKENKVTYPFLPEGKYTFKVKSRNHFNIEGDIISIDIIIIPPWYKTWWFYLIYIAIALFLIAALFRWYNFRLKNANIRLEKTVRTRTSEIEAQKNEIELKNLQLQIINKELEKLSIVAKETDNSIMIMDSSGKFEWINDGFVRLNHYSLDDLIQERADNILDYSKNPEIIKYFNQCVNEKKTVIYESEVVRRDGSFFWAQTTLTPVLSPNGHVSKIVAIDSDITKLKETEREVHKQKEEIEQTRDKLKIINSELEKLSIVASETDNVVMIMDKEGNYEWINESLKKMYGITPEELYKKKGRSLIKTSYTDEIVNIWNSCIKKKKSVTYQALAENYKGNMLWTQTTLTPILDSEGNVIKVIGIDTDISKIKMAEEKIKSQSEELSRNLVELQRKSLLISQSIEYAEKIQKAILHNENNLKEIFPDSFVLLLPRDVVSGDFCWFYKQGSTSVIVAADCTGHGVPGAFMSLIGTSILNEIIRENNIFDPARILGLMNEKVIEVLRQKQSGESIQEDGMDVAVCNYNSDTGVLTFAGANMPLILYNTDGIVKVHGEIFSVGGTFSTRKNVRFKNQIFKTDVFNGFFLFSDGFQDQFGGEQNRKFMADTFTQMLNGISVLPSVGQKEKLLASFCEWKGEARQIDDVLVIGCIFRKT